MGRTNWGLREARHLDVRGGSFVAPFDCESPRLADSLSTMTSLESPLPARPPRSARPARASTVAATKRWLPRVHRWLGLVLWVVFCSWFASGLVMMYASY